MKFKIKLTLFLFLVVIMHGYCQQQEQRLLLGEWTRNESTCQIKITAALDSGKLELTYFNPKSINIGKAYWLIKGTFLSIYIELRNEDSLGSYFKLNYNKERDMLVGEYFQVDGGDSYSVEFVRTKQ